MYSVSFSVVKQFVSAAELPDVPQILTLISHMCLNVCHVCQLLTTSSFTKM